MNKIQFITLFALILLMTSCGQEIIGPEEGPGAQRFNSMVFDRVDVETNVLYGSNITQGGTNFDLVMDIYTGEGDVEMMRPVIILAHGGGFVGGEKEDMGELATYLARSGYVVASIRYRLLDAEYTVTSIKRAVIDAVADMRAAVRFFRKDAVSGNTYRIDPENIFVGGYSAGAFTGLHLAYMNSDEEVMTVGGSELLSYISANGGMEGNSGNPGFSSQVKGVINIAGALVDADFVDSGEPMIFSVHGEGDAVVPFTTGVSDDSGVTTEGSSLIHSVADAVGIVNKLKAIPGGDHGAFFDCNECSPELRTFLFNNL